MLRRGNEDAVFAAALLLLGGAVAALLVVAAAFLGQPSAQYLLGRFILDLPLQGAAAVGQLVAVVALAALISGLAGLKMVRRERRRRRRAEERLQRLAQAAEQAGELVTILTPDGRIVFANPAVERVTGFARREILRRRGAPWLPWYDSEQTFDVVRGTVLAGERFSGTVEGRRKDGAPLVLQEEATGVRDARGRVVHIVSTATDVTREKRFEARLKYIGAHDPVTGLPNRRHFAAELDARLRKGGGLAVIILDVDRFSQVNDMFGAAVGDEVLRRFGRGLRAAAGERDLVARLGSDEFGVIHMGGGLDVEAIAERIRNAVSGNIVVAGQEVVTTVTIGIAVSPESGTDGATLLRHAGMALAGAKGQGRRGILTYSMDLSQEIFGSYALERNLASALRNGEYAVEYQPYCDLASGRITGAEALLRWRSAELGVVSPGLFIPALEASGAIVEVGEWVLRTACCQLKDWSGRRRPVGVAVNLSQIQFRQRDLVQRVADALQASGIDPALLTLELTESVCISDLELAVGVLKRLKDLGVSLSVDDFGTGYSSLSYIRKLPVDTLKIDQSFVREVSRDPDAASIVSAIAGMARSLDLKTIAEGVETEEQRNVLRLLRCDYGQGFLFSPAVPADAFEEYCAAPAAHTPDAVAAL
jgi:diguanylate cyclase (GGDEF)-like protein/PAS domain S-box-containing protein